MKLINFSTCLVAISAMFSVPVTAYADDNGAFSIGGAVGTQGLTVEAKFAASKNIVLRASVNTLPISRDETFDGVDYNADVDFLNLGGFVDLYPSRSGFHISGGVYGGNKTVDHVGVPGPATTVEIGNSTYTGAEIGTLVGDVTYKDVAPYIGLGYDGFIKKDRNWSFNIRAGVMFIGSPDVTLNAEGGLSSNFPSVQTELEREAINLEDELDDFKYYPTINIGITRRF